MENAFLKVKNHLLTNCPDAIESIIDSTEPFVLDYINYPVGYAETDELNDIDKLTKDINNHFRDIAYEQDGRVRRGLINRVITIETTRWNEGRNAWYYGRHIGRLAYLLK